MKCRQQKIGAGLAVESLLQLFECLPGVYFFAKDHEGRFIMANQLFAELCGVATPADVMGKTDWDFFPPERASLYVQDDRRVMATRTALVNRVEPSPSLREGTRLIITSKVALVDLSGRIGGVAGLARDLNPAELSLRATADFQRAALYIEEHYGDPISVPQLAAMEGMSVSRFERRFKEAFQLTPTAYLHHIRIRHACRLLVNGRQSVADIALACGFYDHSHFIRHFRKALGITPLRYRREHQRYA